MELFQPIVLFIQKSISFCGISIIFLGVLIALAQFIYGLAIGEYTEKNTYINDIRLRLGRIIILGLEFIIAADLIGTTTTPDYYDVGILAIIVAIRTVLSYSLNKEIASLTKEELAEQSNAKSAQ